MDTRLIAVLLPTLLVGMALELALSGPAAAQLGVPAVRGVIAGVGAQVGRATGALDTAGSNIADLASRLANERLDRLRTLVHRNPDALELDLAGDPALKGELLLIAPGSEAIETARHAGFAVLGEEQLGDLGFAVIRLGVPARLSLRKAQERLDRLIPGAAVAADVLHFQSGGAAASAAEGKNAASAPTIEAKVGVIDGAPGSAASIGEQRGFARGAPVGSHHGSAVVSLLQLAGVRRIAVADVYGADPAGGSALAIARALDWLVGGGARVITISLVGPANPLLGRAIDAAQLKGVVIVGAVGNDGPAAPPAYPASYPGVLAVTGVDGRDRPLIEAGRALHLDYAAPGADMLARNAAGRWINVRGTSYAAPLVAARAAAAISSGGRAVAVLDREARHIGVGKAAQLYGRGLLCSTCRRTR